MLLQDSSSVTGKRQENHRPPSVASKYGDVDDNGNEDGDEVKFDVKDVLCVVYVFIFGYAVDTQGAVAQFADSMAVSPSSSVSPIVLNSSVVPTKIR